MPWEFHWMVWVLPISHTSPPLGAMTVMDTDGVGVGGGAEGLKSSAQQIPFRSVPPPTARTRPSLSHVAVCSLRALIMLAVADQVPVAGSKSSALERVVAPLLPPATSTRPSLSSVAPRPDFLQPLIGPPCPTHP